MKVYLAARFRDKPKLLEYRDDLIFHGIEVTSRWLIADHEWVGQNDDEMPREVGARFAREDIEDIDAADVVVCFTQEPRVMGNSRGGRHVEFGYALGTGKHIMVVGPLENVFYCLPHVFQHDEWDTALRHLVMTDKSGLLS